MKTLLIFLWQRGFRLFKNDTNATPVKGWLLNVEAGTRKIHVLTSARETDART